MDIATPKYWHVRRTFQRGLALVYLIAFLVTANQFRALLGEHGLLPVPIFVHAVPFHYTPSLFYLFPNDIAFSICAWLGVALSCVALTGLSERYNSWASAAVWTALWMLYLSFVNVGQTFYGFGWETMLLEAGFFAIFLGASRSSPQAIIIWILRWQLFRVMLGAGLIKMRGDPCWRDLTCLAYHYQTQPMPNPLSWYFHWMPSWTHRGGVLFNHFVELVVPFAFFAPQPFARVAGLLTIAFQLLLMLSGNLSFLNLLTMVLAISVLDDRLLVRLLAWFTRARPVEVNETFFYQRLPAIALTIVVTWLSVAPGMNMISPNQTMNASFNPLHIVNTYGAFGSVTRERYQVIVEGTSDSPPTAETVWREYQFKGQPGDVRRMPAQIAPYHLRIDWLMWFAAMSPYYEHPWFVNFMAKLLQGDNAVLGLLSTNPFPEHPPRYVRARLYEYQFTTPDQRRATGLWWIRQPVASYFPAISLEDPGFREVLQRQGWL
jgi:hypothetical protein